MGVDQAGHDGPAAEVDHLGTGRRGRPRGLAGSDGGKLAVLDRHGFDPGARGIRRVDAGVVKDRQATLSSLGSMKLRRATGCPASALRGRTTSSNSYITWAATRAVELGVVVCRRYLHHVRAR